jgi:hypothetical protein
LDCHCADNYNYIASRDNYNHNDCYDHCDDLASRDDDYYRRNNNGSANNNSSSIFTVVANVIL